MHKITQINKEESTGVCSICGPVSIRILDHLKKNGENAVVCRTVQRTRRRKYQAIYRATDKGGFNEYKREHKRKKNIIVSEELFHKHRATTHCECCGELNGIEKALCLDHDHKTNKIRGFLCNNCNTGLGMFKDSPEVLAKAIIYLSTHQS